MNNSLQDIFYICASFGGIATAISIIVLLIKDARKSNRISNLERVAQALERDLEVRYMPHLWINGVGLREGENRINFDLNNKREWCKILDFRIISGDLILDERNKHLPYELEPKFSQTIVSDTTRRYIFTLNNSNKQLNDVEYTIEIVYENRLNQKYSIVLKGVGSKYTLDNPKKV